MAALLGALAVALAFTPPRHSAQAVEDVFVCAQLVIAVDASTSTQEGAFDRQIAALSDALSRPRLAAAVQDCLPGTLGLAILTWSGPGQQALCQPWTPVRSAGDMAAVADRLLRCPELGGTTDMGGALDAALDLIATSPFESHYRIVYLLTNGRTDEGREAELRAARGQAEAAGVTITGHALLRRASFWKAPKNRFDPFHRYVDLEVTTGPRSFTSASDVGEDEAEVLEALVRMLRQELN
jgi:hypothetical protein